MQFLTRSGTLTKSSKTELDKLVNALLNDHPQIKVSIEGHTDDTGSDDFNQKLSEKRAEAVKAYLVAQKVDADRISTVGYGKSHPAEDNGTADGKARNRRVEFKVSQ